MGSNAPFLQPRSGDIELSKHYVAAPRLNMFDPYPTAHAVGYVDVAAPRLREVAYLLIVRHSSLSTKHCSRRRNEQSRPTGLRGPYLRRSVSGLFSAAGTRRLSRLISARSPCQRPRPCRARIFFARSLGNGVATPSVALSSMGFEGIPVLYRPLRRLQQTPQLLRSDPWPGPSAAARLRSSSRNVGGEVPR